MGQQSLAFFIQLVSNTPGLFVVNGNEILYSQETHITFWCPMRFQNFPLDSQTCKFKVNYNTFFSVLQSVLVLKLRILYHVPFKK